MDEHIENPIAPDSLASRIYISLRQLERLFQQCLQCTPSQYYLSLRLARARQLLCETGLNVSQIAVACGFNSAAHFSRSYRSHFAISPKMQRQIVINHNIETS